LREAFCDVANFVTHHFTSIIMLALADELAPQRALASGDFGPWDKHEHFEFFETADFVLGTSDPVLPFGGGHRFGPQGVIFHIDIWFQGAVRGGRKNLRDGNKVRNWDLKGNETVSLAVGHKFGQKGSDVAIITFID
jgi:hypothetical protein